MDKIKNLVMQPKRTNKTKLSNDELLLFDFLAILGDVSFNLIRRENYSFHMCVPYSHEIPDNYLEKTMKKLISEGYLSSYFDEEPRYFLTEIGGNLWESERNPIWEKYCRSYYGSNGDERGNLLGIVCTRKDIGLEYAKVSLECKLYSFDLNELKSRSAEPDELLVYWKKFENAWIWEVDLRDEPDSYDCNIYEKKRIWWGNLDELQKFL